MLQQKAPIINQILPLASSSRILFASADRLTHTTFWTPRCPRVLNQSQFPWLACLTGQSYWNFLPKRNTLLRLNSQRIHKLGSSNLGTEGLHILCTVLFGTSPWSQGGQSLLFGGEGWCQSRLLLVLDMSTHDCIHPRIHHMNKTIHHTHQFPESMSKY